MSAFQRARSSLVDVWSTITGDLQLGERVEVQTKRL
jgi:hypothetical protein